MKNTMRKIISAVSILAMAASVTACSSTATTNNSGKVYKIGVIQYAPHPSLDDCYTGFKKGLAESGLTVGKNVTIDFQNAQGDTSNSDLIAKNMVSKKYDMIMGIATPAAMSAYSAAKTTNIPVVFTAISDPIAAGLVKTLSKPGTNCTGSSDVLPHEKQLQMIRAFLPKAKKIGILYTTSEPNSVSNLKTFKTLAPKYNFEVVDVGVTNASEVAAGAQTLVSKGVDCVNNFTDNNVVNNLSTLLKATNAKKIPVFGSEIDQVKNGCLASESIDFVALGDQTGKMAAKILKGESKASDMAVLQIKDCAPVYSKTVMEQFGLTLPSDYSSATAVSK